MFNKWVIDAKSSNDDILCFCPIEEYGVVLGMSVVSRTIPYGEFVGIYHEDGDAAANNWYHEHKAIVESYINEAQMSGRKFVKPDYISA